MNDPLQGFRILFYLDDRFNIADSYDGCDASTKNISECLEKSGCLVNVEKSELEPKQSGEWLGVEIDTRRMMYTVPQKKDRQVKAAPQEHLRI